MMEAWIRRDSFAAFCCKPMHQKRGTRSFLALSCTPKQRIWAGPIVTGYEGTTNCLIFFGTHQNHRELHELQELHMGKRNTST